MKNSALQPTVRLKEHAPNLYRVLKEYYRLDPALRLGRSTCAAEDDLTPASPMI